MTYQVAIGHSDIAFPAESGETVLDAAERAGYSLPYSCRKGVCSTCEAGLRAGTVEIGARSIEVPAPAVLLCRVKPFLDFVCLLRTLHSCYVSGSMDIVVMVA